MKILATSDLHGNIEGLDLNGADVVVLAGSRIYTVSRLDERYETACEPAWVEV